MTKDPLESTIDMVGNLQKHLLRLVDICERQQQYISELRDEQNTMRRTVNRLVTSHNAMEQASAGRILSDEELLPRLPDRVITIPEIDDADGE